MPASPSACKNEWQYVQRVVADTAPFFAPLEEAILTHLLPSFLGIPSTENDGEYRQLLTHSVKMGGLAIRNPTDTALLCSQGIPCSNLPPDGVSCGYGNKA